MFRIKDYLIVQYQNARRIPSDQRKKKQEYDKITALKSPLNPVTSNIACDPPPS